jgi:hypothetical protein
MGLTGFFREPLGLMHSQDRLPGSGVTQHSCRATEISGGQYFLLGVQKTPATASGGIHDGGKCRIIIDHHKVGLSLGALQ